MSRADELTIGNSVLVDGVPRIVSAITRKKVGYHKNPREGKLWYVRLSEVKARPLDEKIVSTFNRLSERNAFIYWDDRCPDCEHQYMMIVKGQEFVVRYVHQVARIAKVFDIKQCIFDGYWE